MQVINSAYVAGLADSDGSFTISIRHKDRPVPHYYACFQLSWKQSENSLIALNLLKSKYGGTICSVQSRKPTFANNPNMPKMYKYFCGSKHVESLIKDCLPFLQLKKEQAETIMLLRSTMGNHGNKRSKPAELTKFHHSLYLKMKKLNTKNSGDRSNAGN